MAEYVQVAGTNGASAFFVERALVAPRPSHTRKFRMNCNHRLNLPLTTLFAGAFFLLGCGIRDSENLSITTATEDTTGSEYSNYSPDGLLENSPAESASPTPNEGDTSVEISEIHETESQATETVTPTIGTPTETTTKVRLDTKPAVNNSNDTPKETPPQSTAPTEAADHKRERGSSLPTKSPFAFIGWEEVFYMPENGVQAGLYGLEPNQVRTWVYSNQPGNDLAEEHRKITSAIRSSGGRINLDPLVRLPPDGTGTINGRWEGFTFVVVVTHWESISFSLLDW